MKCHDTTECRPRPAALPRGRSRKRATSAPGGTTLLKDDPMLDFNEDPDEFLMTTRLKVEPPHFTEEDLPGLIKIDGDSPPPPNTPSLPDLSVAGELDPMGGGGHCGSSGGGNLLDESLIKEEILREFGYGEQQQGTDLMHMHLDLS